MELNILISPVNLIKVFSQSFNSNNIQRLQNQQNAYLLSWWQADTKSAKHLPTSTTVCLKQKH